jgi:chromosome segregation ATPase
MEDSFELLEQRVRKTAELVRRLRKDNRSLEEDLAKSRGRAQEAEKKLEALEKERSSAPDQGKQLEAAASELKLLRQEREEVRRRIARLVEVLDGLE